MISVVLLFDVTSVLALTTILLLLARGMRAEARHWLCVTALSVSLLLPISPRWLPAPSSTVFTAVARSAMDAQTAHPMPVHWLQIIWLCGAILVAARFLAGAIYLHVQARRAAAFPVPPHELALLTRATVSARLASIASPIVCGWFHPKILLPQAALNWPEDRLRLALLHELAHLERRDLWARLIDAAAQAIYWFHPLVWWISARAVEAQELACDDRVLVSGAPPAEYATLLVDTARQLSSNFLFGCPMVSHTHFLRGRIMHILQFRSKGASADRMRSAGYLLPGLVIAAGLMLPAAAPYTGASTGPDKVYKVGGDVKSPAVISKIEPSYTDAARDAKIQGVALLSLIIDRLGVPKDVTVTRGLDPGLDRNAVEAVQQWRFHPALKDGQPVSVSVSVEVNFRLK